jgi:hypothetical protein
MPEIQIKTRAAESVVRRLSAAIETLIQEGGRTEAEAVTYAALQVAQSGRRQAKVSKKNRKIIKNFLWHMLPGGVKRTLRAIQAGKPVSERRRMAAAPHQGKTPYLIERFTQKKRELLPAWGKKDPRKVIQNRGLAKQTWNIMVGKLGQSAPGGRAHSAAKRTARGKARVIKRMRLGSAEVQLQNWVMYMQKAYPGIVQKAMGRGMRALENRVKAIVAKRMRRLHAV